MSTMDIKKLKAELAAELNIIVDEKDPIFATVFLNEKILKHHVEIVTNDQEKLVSKIASLHELQKNNMQESLAIINKDQEDRFKKYLNHLKDNKPIITNEVTSNKSNSILYAGIGLLVGAILATIYHNMV